MKRILILVLILGVIALFSCKRNAVDDPQQIGPASYHIVLKGNANPSTLYIPVDLTSQASLITVNLTNNGKPLAGKTIILEQWAENTRINWGYFGNYLNTIEVQTNSNGDASAYYYFPNGPLPHNPPSDMRIYIKAIYKGDYYNEQMSEVYQMIPILIVPFKDY